MRDAAEIYNVLCSPLAIDQAGRRALQEPVLFQALGQIACCLVVVRAAWLVRIVLDQVGRDVEDVFHSGLRFMKGYWRCHIASEDGCCSGSGILMRHWQRPTSVGSPNSARRRAMAATCTASA